MQFTTCGFFIQPSYIFNVKVSNPTCFLATILDFQLLGFFPGAPLTNFNDGRGGRGEWVGGWGGVQQRFIFYSQKNHNFRICLPKKSLLFLAYPKKSLSPFFATEKNPSVFFCDPKNSQHFS